MKKSIDICFIKMKKTKCLLALVSYFLCGGGNLVCAQPYIPWPTDSAQWSVRHTNNSPFSQDSYQFKMKGDTVINGLTYSKIYYSLDLNYSSLNETLHCFTREDSTRKVWIKYPTSMGVDTNEFVLYDFNLAEGDTFTIRLLYFFTDSIYKFVVIDTFMFPTLVDTRVYYDFGPIAPWPWGGCEFSFDWYRGIGSFRGPFYCEIYEGDCGASAPNEYETSCFWERGVYIAGGTLCDYTTSIYDFQISEYDFQIYPNPITESSVLEFSNIKFEKLEVYNLLGQKIKDYDVSGKEQVILEKRDFIKGYYIFRLVEKAGYYRTGNFIVQ